MFSFADQSVKLLQQSAFRIAGGAPRTPRILGGWMPAAANGAPRDTHSPTSSTVTYRNSGRRLHRSRPRCRRPRVGPAILPTRPGSPTGTAAVYPKHRLCPANNSLFNVIRGATLAVGSNWARSAGVESDARPYPAAKKWTAVRGWAASSGKLCPGRSLTSVFLGGVVDAARQ